MASKIRVSHRNSLNEPELVTFIYDRISGSACASRATAPSRSMPCWPCAQRQGHCPPPGSRALRHPARSARAGRQPTSVGNILKKNRWRGAGPGQPCAVAGKLPSRRCSTCCYKVVPQADAAFAAGDYTASLLKPWLRCARLWMPSVRRRDVNAVEDPALKTNRLSC